MLLQVTRVLFNCGSSKGRVKRLPGKDTFKMVMTKAAVLDSLDNALSGWSKSSDQALRQGLT